MNKVFTLAPKEDWIVDRFVSEWNEDNQDIASSLEDSNVIWLMADWAWRQIPFKHMANKKILTTIHHIVPEKFGNAERFDFQLRDDITTAYHVPNVHTQKFVSNLTTKPIHVIPYWANQKIWKHTALKEELRLKYELPTDVYLIGSFQRDTEGSDLISPKLEKGPDLLADAIIQFATKAKKYFSIEVVLAGWRRQYIMNRLSKANIKFHYFEKPSQIVINELYQTLDLYPVTARYEGGPQSLIECGILGIPMVSRDIGMASLLLPASAINEDVSLAIPACPTVNDLLLPAGYMPYRDLLNSL